MRRERTCCTNVWSTFCSVEAGPCCGGWWCVMWYLAGQDQPGQLHWCRVAEHKQEITGMEGQTKQIVMQHYNPTNPPLPATRVTNSHIFCRLCLFGGHETRHERWGGSEGRLLIIFLVMRSQHCHHCARLLCPGSKDFISTYLQKAVESSGVAARQTSGQVQLMMQFIPLYFPPIDPPSVWLCNQDSGTSLGVYTVLMMLISTSPEW